MVYPGKPYHFNFLNWPTSNEGEETAGTVENTDNQIFLHTDIDTESATRTITALHKVAADLYKEQQLKMLEAPNPIWLRINSFGGDLFSAFAILDEISRVTVPVYSLVEGLAASAATIIATGCDKRFISPSGFMMLHQPETWFAGNFEQFKDETKIHDMLLDKLVKHYEKYSSLTETEIREKLTRNWWISAAEALEIGFMDAIR